MSTNTTNKRVGQTCLSVSSLVGQTFLSVLVLFIAIGCSTSSTPSPSPTAADPPATQPLAKGGAQLWSETCSRCHNTRSPTEFSRAEWQVIMHHMRVRADLTGEEQRQILDFLKSAD